MEVDLSLVEKTYVSIQLINKINEMPEAEIVKFNNEYVLIYRRNINDNDEVYSGLISKIVPGGHFEFCESVYYNPDDAQLVFVHDEWSNEKVPLPDNIVHFQKVYRNENDLLNKADEEEKYDDEFESDELVESKDVTYRGILKLIDYLYGINPNQLANHLKYITEKMCARRKIEQLLLVPNDKKEINRYYSAIREFNRMEKIERKKRKDGDIDKIDFDTIYKKVSDRWHLKICDIDSVLQAKKRASRTSKTKLFGQS